MNEPHENTSLTPVGIPILVKTPLGWEKVTRTKWGYSSHIKLKDGTKLPIRGIRWRYP